MRITVGGSFTDYVNNYVKNLPLAPVAAGDYVLISDVSDTGKSKKVTVQSIASLAAKAWVSFDGANQTAYSTQSFNVSSIVRNGATSGFYRVSFTVAMPATNYVVLGTVGTGAEIWNNVGTACVRIFGSQLGYVDVVTVAQNINAIDFGYTSIAIFSS